MSKATAQSAEDPILQWVTFRLDNESYGINVMQVQEVLRYTEIAPVPGAPSYVLGIINLRGNEESAKFIQGVCNKNGELLILVELDKMMTEEEWSELGSI
ncbi:TPA: chemotaxis protein CheW [Pseudomonas aeruginosa]|nr:chemotaxis protein CheW [Pseudomonas aeruginosa]